MTLIVETLQNRRQQGNASLSRRPNRLGIGIIGPADETQNQLILRFEFCQPVAEIQFNPMLFRIAEPTSLGEIIDGLPIPLGERLCYILATMIAGFDVK